MFNKTTKVVSFGITKLFSGGLTDKTRQDKYKDTFNFKKISLILGYFLYFIIAVKNADAQVNISFKTDLRNENIQFSSVDILNKISTLYFLDLILSSTALNNKVVIDKVFELLKTHPRTQMVESSQDIITYTFPEISNTSCINSCNSPQLIIKTLYCHKQTNRNSDLFDNLRPLNKTYIANPSTSQYDGKNYTQYWNANLSCTQSVKDKYNNKLRTGCGYSVLSIVKNNQNQTWVSNTTDHASSSGYGTWDNSNYVKPACDSNGYPYANNTNIRNKFSSTNSLIKAEKKAITSCQNTCKEKRMGITLSINHIVALRELYVPVIAEKIINSLFDVPFTPTPINIDIVRSSSLVVGTTKYLETQSFFNSVSNTDFKKKILNTLAAIPIAEIYDPNMIVQ
jgi:hypothetical protein